MESRSLKLLAVWVNTSRRGVITVADMDRPLGMLAKGLQATIDVAFPPVCAACGMGIGGESNRGFCPACRADLVLFEEEVCPRCASPQPASSPSEASDCAACREERWAFEAVLALGPYEGLLRRLVLESKHRSGEAAASELGRLLAEQHQERLPSEAVVAYVPQHWSRRITRRADGVRALADGLAQASGLRRCEALRRVRATPRQTSVAPSARRSNVRGAFEASHAKALAGRPVLLVDDVLTTGSTCDAAARALRQAGAERVVAVVAARRVGGL